MSGMACARLPGMSSLEDRVTALEERLGMESGLRASTDRDLGDMAASMRAQRHLIQALSITQGEHTNVLERHTEMLARLEADVTELKGGVAHIVALLERLIDQPPESSP